MYSNELKNILQVKFLAKILEYKKNMPIHIKQMLKSKIQMRTNNNVD